jgi:hypothetical protein
MLVDQSTQGTPLEKGNAEEDGNCAIHGRSSNRPMTDSRNGQTNLHGTTCHH